MGQTWVSDFLEVSEFSANHFSADAFVVRFSSSGSAVELSSYYGTGKIDEARTVTTDGSSNIYVGIYRRDYETPRSRTPSSR